MMEQQQQWGFSTEMNNLLQQQHSSSFADSSSFTLNNGSDQDYYDNNNTTLVDDDDIITTITTSAVNYTSSSSTTTTTTSSSSTPSPSALLNSFYYRSLSQEERRKYDFHHQLPGEPSHEVVVAILCLSATVLACSSLVLLATRYTSGGRSGTLVFLRSLLLSDILMAVYGLTKMIVLLLLPEIRVHFFLPDSLFFTASLASSSSLLSLNLDCFLKLARPFQYAQVSKDRVISCMLLVWNAAFVVGFLPLVGWHDEAYTFRFFSFYPWHFLLFNGLAVLVCVVVCIACMLWLRKFYTLPDTDPSCFSARTLEIRKYRRLHRTIVIESSMWLASYLPFFIYLALMTTTTTTTTTTMTNTTCGQEEEGQNGQEEEGRCSSHFADYKDAIVLYFLPVFLAKSLFSAFLQAFRTFRVHAVMNKIITDLSHHQHNHNHHHRSSHYSHHSHNQNNHHHHPHQHRRRRRQRPLQQDSITTSINNDASVSTIAYTNPLCEQQLQQGQQLQNSTEDHPSHHHGNTIDTNTLFLRRPSTATLDPHELSDMNHRNQLNHNHNHHHRYNYHHPDCPHYHHHNHQHQHRSNHHHDHNINHRYHDIPIPGRFLLDADNWTLHPPHHLHHHPHYLRRRHYLSDDGLTDDDYDDFDDGLMMSRARLEIHGSDENIVGIANMGFRPSLDFHDTPILDQQQSTKL